MDSSRREVQNKSSCIQSSLEQLSPRDLGGS